MWIVCAYYTIDTVYEEHTRNLIESLKKFSISYDITSIDNLGNWYKNTQYKPTFLKQMLKKHHPYSLVYVDVDAIFCRYPDYFDKLDKTPEVDIAVHMLDHSKYRRRNHPPEMLSGTIFLRNTNKVRAIVDAWIEKCQGDPNLWDQIALSKVLKNHRYHLLPEEYCMIFDYMQSVKNPVIKHFQASRGERRKRSRVSENPHRAVSTNSPRRVTNNGIIHIRRANRIS